MTIDNRCKDLKKKVMKIEKNLGFFSVMIMNEFRVMHATAYS